MIESGTMHASTPDLASFGGKEDVWLGFKRTTFEVDGCACWVAEPATPLPGNHWAWCMMFPDAFPKQTGAADLLARGYYYVFMDVGNTFGAPSALAHLDAFYQALTAIGFRAKAVLIGISRGGLYACNWAAKNPDKVSVIYGDAPVCSIASWPYAQGANAKGRDWIELKSLYGFKTDEEAIANRMQPIYEVAALVMAGIALISVVGDLDDAVPYADNTAVVEKEYQKLNGTISVIHKADCGHHPHGLDDPTPVVDFILRHDP